MFYDINTDKIVTSDTTAFLTLQWIQGINLQMQRESFPESEHNQVMTCQCLTVLLKCMERRETANLPQENLFALFNLR